MMLKEQLLVHWIGMTDIMGDTYKFSEIYTKGLSGEMKIHELALAMRDMDINLIPKTVGERLNTNMTDTLIGKKVKKDETDTRDTTR